jgi:hypothetical protein
MALEPIKHVNGQMCQSGQSGNPNGRPVGSRTAFSQGLLKDLASVWAERGRAAMEKTAIDQPGAPAGLMVPKLTEGNRKNGS